MSYTNTITPKYEYNTYAQGVKPFLHGANNVAFFDKRHNQNPSVSKTDLQIKQLKVEFKLAKNEQGVIGKAWNGIKNLFQTEYSSSNIEKALNSLNSNSTDEEINNVRNMIAKYRSKQDLAVDTVATTGATIAAGAAGAKVGAMIGSVICPGAGTIVGGILGCIGGAIVGAVAKVGICQLENMTDSVDNNAWHNDKNIGKEVTSGALSGATAMLFGGIAKKVSGACKSALGITKQGVVLTENGTANVARTVTRTALAEGAGGAAASTIIADGEYLIRCATDKNTEFSWGDLAQTTGISAITGGVMSAGFGAITGYRGAKIFNKEWNNTNSLLKELRNKKIICRQVNKNVIAGETFANKSIEDLKLLKDKGIKTIIDFREHDEAYKIMCESIGLKYESCPLIHISDLSKQTLFSGPYNQTVSNDFVKNLRKLLDLGKEGNVYMGCNYGIDRTNFGIILEYLFNSSSTSKIPRILPSDMGSSRTLLNRNLDLIRKIVKRLNIEQKACLGIDDNFDNLLKSKIRDIVIANKKPIPNHVSQLIFEKLDR